MKGYDFKSYRESLNMTQELLAARLGISRATVNRWEQADEVPTLAELAISRLVLSTSERLDTGLFRVTFDDYGYCTVHGEKPAVRELAEMLMTAGGKFERIENKWGEAEWSMSILRNCATMPKSAT